MGDALWDWFIKFEATSAFVTLFLSGGSGGAAVIGVTVGLSPWIVVPLCITALVLFLLFGAWVIAHLRRVPEGPGYMSPDERAHYEKTIVPKVKACPICGNQNWKLPNHFVRLPIHHQTAGAAHETVYVRCFPIFCQACTCALLFNATMTPPHTPIQSSGFFPVTSAG